MESIYQQSLILSVIVRVKVRKSQRYRGRGGRGITIWRLYCREYTVDPRYHIKIALLELELRSSRFLQSRIKYFRVLIEKRHVSCLLRSFSFYFLYSFLPDVDAHTRPLRTYMLSVVTTFCVGGFAILYHLVEVPRIYLIRTSSFACGQEKA